MGRLGVLIIQQFGPKPSHTLYSALIVFFCKVLNNQQVGPVISTDQMTQKPMSDFAQDVKMKEESRERC